LRSKRLSAWVRGVQQRSPVDIALKDKDRLAPASTRGDVDQRAEELDALGTWPRITPKDSKRQDLTPLPFDLHVHSTTLFFIIQAFRPDNKLTRH
jgi:hypothetical protein